MAPDGSLFGTTSEGGHGAGDTVYRLLFPAGDLNHDGLADCSDITLVNRRFDLAFDPTILAATLVLPGSLLPGCCFNAGTIDNTVGTIVDIADTRSGPDPGVTLAPLHILLENEENSHLCALSAESRNSRKLWA